MQQVIMEGSSSSSGTTAPTWWSSSNMMTTFPQPPNNSEMWHQDHGSQDLPESWCQFILGGFVAEEERHGFKKMEINNSCGVSLDQLLREQVVFPSPPLATQITGFLPQQHDQVQSHGSSSWNKKPILAASSPLSCVTTSFSAHNMLDFSHKPRQQSDANNSSEGNSMETAPALKKARVLGGSSKSTLIKVRKEKLGDRITTLHQLVSPFGKTDTASVLQEAIGYIRFLHSQIQALSSPYLQQQQQQAMRQQKQMQLGNDDADGDDETRKDLRSRGLCLVPVSFTMHVGSDNGADLWAAALGGGF